ncbi:NADPH-dependent FMN reductase [Pseudomonas fluorescens]|uniref:NADPH-dependent FMN reductase n=1 Tax=Pseudomonas fluorescens TaxID=294 RepID=UPI0009B8A758|nr:NAD(P)H-dependent oxidoreductase [Pseudomonas fluorescens]
MNSHVVVIVGSNRSNSQSLKVAKFLQKRLEELNICDSIHLLDLASIRLPLWPERDLNEVWADQKSALQKATSLIVISPEWHGMACPAIKNLFFYAGLSEVGHKPALLVGVSAGIGGAYPLIELRTSSFKNCRIAYLPEQLIVRQVECMLNDQEPHDENDCRLRARIDWSLIMLSSYDKALRSVRKDINMHLPDFANGM